MNISISKIIGLGIIAYVLYDIKKKKEQQDDVDGGDSVVVTDNEKGNFGALKVTLGRCSVYFTDGRPQSGLYIQQWISIKNTSKSVYYTIKGIEWTIDVGGKSSGISNPEITNMARRIAPGETLKLKYDIKKQDYYEDELLAATQYVREKKRYDSTSKVTIDAVVGNGTVNVDFKPVTMPIDLLLGFGKNTQYYVG